MKQTAESIEAEATAVRSQLVVVGADIRHHADPARIVDAAKSSFKRRAEDVPAFLKQNANPVGMLMLGGTLGLALTGFLSRSRRPPAAPGIADNPSTIKAAVRPTMKLKIDAALLSTVSVGLGYVAGMFVPTSAAEEQLLVQPKAILTEHLDEFMKEHARGMKMAAANILGISRLSAATLVGMAMVAEALQKSQRRAKSETL
jgi:hypothetical protein